MDASSMIASLIEIVWLDLILSGDNAVLLAENTRALPVESRRIGVNLGTALFIVLRVAFAYGLLSAAHMAGVGLIGAALLVLSSLAPAMRGEGARDPVPPRRSLAAAVVACVGADLPVALQNMLAVQAAARGSKPLVMLGLALSIPLLALGSAQFITLLRRPPLLWAGAGLIGWVAGQMAAADTLVLGSAMPPEIMHDFAPPVGAVAAFLLAYGFLRGRQSPRVVEE
jgi:YjbE family integral membrane protein